VKVKFRVPYFEIGIKNYIYGDDVLNFAQAVDKFSVKYDVDVMMIIPYTEIRRVSENTEHIVVLAPYMDLLYPGRGLADVLPEAVKAAGARGVVVNHCEKPMSLSAVAQTIERARSLDMLSFACADTIQEAKAIAMLHPDIINPEPTELIGGSQMSSMDYIRESIRVIKEIDENIIVEQAASITTAKQVYDLIYAGIEATGSASGIFKSAKPLETAESMIRAVREAMDDRKKENVVYGTN